MLRNTPVVDFHSHIIPQADHGCKDLSMLKAQLALMKKSGTDTVVATPHFYPHIHRVSDFSAQRCDYLNALSADALKDAPEIKIGAEVLICEGLDKMDGIDQLCIKGTKLLLLELPQSKITDGHIETVEALTDNGYTVVLAHIDRYIGHFQQEIDTMLSIGAYAQVNADVIGHPILLHKIVKYLEETDRICAFGSDLHESNKRDYACFGMLPRVFKEHFHEVMNRSLALLEGSESFAIKK